MGTQKELLYFENVHFYRDRLWFTDIRFNELYQYDFQTKQVSIETSFDEDYKNGRIFGSIIGINNELCLVPFHGTKLYIYNIDNQKTTFINFKIPPSDSVFQTKDAVRFLSAYKYDNRIFMIGNKYPWIVECNLETEQIMYHLDWIDEIKNYTYESFGAVFNRAVVVENRMYIPYLRGNVVLEFHMDTYYYQIHRIGNLRHGFSAICYDGNSFWLAPMKEKRFWRWNEKTGETREIVEFPSQYIYRPDGLAFNEMIYWNEHILAIPLSANMILDITQEGEINELDVKLRGENAIRCCTGYDKLFACSRSSGKLLIFDTAMHCEKKTFFMPPSTLKKFNKLKLYDFYAQKKEDCILCESNESLLEEFVSYIIEN